MFICLLFLQHIFLYLADPKAEPIVETPVAFYFLKSVTCLIWKIENSQFLTSCLARSLGKVMPEAEFYSLGQHFSLNKIELQQKSLLCFP